MYQIKRGDEVICSARMSFDAIYHFTQALQDYFDETFYKSDDHEKIEYPHKHNEEIMKALNDLAKRLNVNLTITKE